ncbi:hypothetical protein Trydic_g12291 [Trypoxylus dichotomus]
MLITLEDEEEIHLDVNFIKAVQLRRKKASIIGPKISVELRGHLASIPAEPLQSCPSNFKKKTKKRLLVLPNFTPRPEPNFSQSSPYRTPFYNNQQTQPQPTGTTTSAHSHTIHRQTFPQNFHFDEFHQQYDPEPYYDSNCLEYHNENDSHECSTPLTDLYSEPPQDPTEYHPEENLHPYASQDDGNFRMIASNQKSKD